MRSARGGVRGGGCLEDGGVIDGKSDGKLHVRSPRETGVDGTSVVRNLTAIARGWKDCGLHIQV
jgi:hypothetical protein